jgi:hypothetical protein
MAQEKRPAWNNFFKTVSILGAGVGREPANHYNALWPAGSDCCQVQVKWWHRFPCLCRLKPAATAISVCPSVGHV